MSLIKNTFWNLSGYVIPSIVAIPSLGILARNLGPERFGLFTLAVAIVGYASIFDAGLTRAVIREISIFKDDLVEKNKIVANSSLILSILGVIGGSTIYFCGPTIVHLLNVRLIYHIEALKAVSLISLSLPFFLLNQVWLAILEGQEEFKKINLIKTFNSSFIAGMPALFSLFSATLSWAVMGLVFARFISLIITFLVCKDHVLKAGFNVNKSTASRLMKYGGWITVSNIISPLMSYFDRFIVSHIMGASHVAFYTAPAEGVQRLTIFPSALSRAVFPKLSGRYAFREKNKQRKLAYCIMIAATLPIALFGMVFSKPILMIWLGENYGGLAAEIFKILMLGFFFNSIAQIPFASIQAAGFSKVTAMIHLCELVPYLVILYYFINLWGVTGAAIAWTLRILVDCLVLIIINGRLIK